MKISKMNLKNNLVYSILRTHGQTTVYYWIRKTGNTNIEVRSLQQQSNVVSVWAKP